MDKVMKVIDRFVNLQRSICSGGGKSNEARTRMSKARPTFIKLGHLWRQRGIFLKLNMRLYKTTNCQSSATLRLRNVAIKVCGHKIFRGILYLCLIVPIE